MKIKEEEIRAKLIERLNTYNNCRIEEEFTTPSGKARADILAVNGHINAYEIKSDYDSLIRLPNQIKEYDKCFEKNYLVTVQKFMQKSLSILPSHWGIIVVEKNDNHHLKLKFIRHAKLNPNLEFNSLVQHLSSTDLKKFINNRMLNEKLKLSKNEVRNIFKYPLINLCSDFLNKKDKKLLTMNVREILKRG